MLRPIKETSVEEDDDNDNGSHETHVGRGDRGHSQQVAIEQRSSQTDHCQHTTDERSSVSSISENVQLRLRMLAQRHSTSARPHFSTLKVENESESICESESETEKLLKKPQDSKCFLQRNLQDRNKADGVCVQCGENLGKYILANFFVVGKWCLYLNLFHLVVN